MIFLDVDHFKVVNDSLGHNCGDDLLKVAAERISATIRPGDTVARFGGDEFVIVCNDVSAEVTVEIAARVLDSLSQVFVIGGQEMSVTASMGIAVSDCHLDVGQPAPRLRRRDVSREGPRPRPDRGVRRGVAGQGRAPVGNGVCTASRASNATSSPSTTSRSWTSRPEHWSVPRRCCAGPTRTSGLDRPGRVHPDRRGHRSDSPDRRMGARAGLSRSWSCGSGPRRRCRWRSTSRSARWSRRTSLEWSRAC